MLHGGMHRLYLDFIMRFFTNFLLAVFAVLFFWTCFSIGASDLCCTVYFYLSCIWTRFICVLYFLATLLMVVGFLISGAICIN